MLVKELPSISIQSLEAYMKATTPETRGEALNLPTANSLIIFAGAEWCRPCGRTYQELPDPEELADPTQISYRYCDANRDEFVVGYCSIRSFPSAAIFVGGKFDKVVGLNPQKLASILSFKTPSELTEFNP